MLPHINLSNGDHTIQAENIPIGIYKLIVQTSSDYFRSPKGYILRVSEAGAALSTDQILHFKVVPTNKSSLPPCRNITMDENNPSLDQEICMAEGLIDISGPISMEQLRSNPNSPDYGNYYYAGPRTSQDHQGVQGRNYVVDPSLDQGVEYDQFVAERVYADNGSNWMEAGWIEKSWLDDQQYIYAMDTNLAESMIFEEYSISSGSEVETKVYYNSEIGKWRANYHLGGGSWIVLREEEIGFTIADNGYNRGEVWENTGVLPLLPPSLFDKGELFVDGLWTNWDTRYETFLRIDYPYQLDMITEYNYFVIHSPTIYLPLVMMD